MSCTDRWYTVVVGGVIEDICPSYEEAYVLVDILRGEGIPCYVGDVFGLPVD